MDALGLIGYRALFGAVLAISGSIQAETPRPTDKPATVTPERRDKTRGRVSRETAEDLLRALRRSKPIQEVVPPASAGSRPNRPSRPSLLPEGHTVVDRSGYLSQDGMWWTFANDAESDEPTVKLLPNENLEVMVRSSAGTDGARSFTISGEMTVFRGENYLLVRLVRRAPLPVRPRAQLRRQAASGRASAGDQTQGPAPGSAEGLDNISAEEVISALQSRQPRAVIAQPAAPQLPPGVGKGVASSMLRRDGSPLVRRPGRIVQEGSWWTFVFESDRPDYGEPVLKLLPSRGVEMMLQAADHGTTGLVLIVSGEVTRFGNENFLLPRAVVRRIQKGNLRR